MNTLTGQKVMDTYTRLIQVVDGLFYDGDGNPISFGTSSFHFIQPGPSLQWNVTHNLSRFPNVSIVDTAGNVLFADVQHISLNTLTIKFNQSTSGEAWCS